METYDLFVETKLEMIELGEEYEIATESEIWDVLEG